MVGVCVLNTFEDVSINLPNKRGVLIRKNRSNSLNEGEIWHQINVNGGEGLPSSDTHTAPIRGINQSVCPILEQFPDDMISKSALKELDGGYGERSC